MQQLYVITLPVLKEDLPAIERSINEIAIPKQFIKVAIDPIAKKGIAFLMPNQKLRYPIAHYAVTIDQAEQLTGYDFFNQLESGLQEEIECALDKEHWFPEMAQGDVTPLYPPDLPRAHFNTVQAKRYIDKNDKIIVCGKVVSGRTTRKGNVMLNLDQKYPNAIFSVFIPKDKIINFPYDPVTVLIGEDYCFKGKIDGYMKHPSMRVEKEEVIKRYDGRKTKKSG